MNDILSRGHAWQGEMCGRVECVAWDVCGRGHLWQGTCVQRGVCGRVDMCGRGLCVAGKTATAVDGMYPTGMHSCYCPQM